MRQRDRERGRGVCMFDRQCTRVAESNPSVDRAGVSKIETKSVKLVSISKESMGQVKDKDYTAQSPKHARTTTNRRTHSASPIGSCSPSLVGRSRWRSRTTQPVLLARGLRCNS